MPPQKKKSVKLSEHFSSKDFMCKCDQCDGALKISMGLLGGLELLRSNSHARIEIIKGYVCPECEKINKKAKKNYHAIGLAADIKIDGQTPVQLFKLAEAIPEFKGLGLNLTEKHVHVDTRKEIERKTWVETQGEIIELTAANRAQYLD